MQKVWLHHSAAHCEILLVCLFNYLVDMTCVVYIDMVVCICEDLSGRPGGWVATQLSKPEQGQVYGHSKVITSDPVYGCLEH